MQRQTKFALLGLGKHETAIWKSYLKKKAASFNTMYFTWSLYVQVTVRKP